MVGWTVFSRQRTRSMDKVNENMFYKYSVCVLPNFYIKLFTGWTMATVEGIKYTFGYKFNILLLPIKPGWTM